MAAREIQRWPEPPNAAISEGQNQRDFGDYGWSRNQAKSPQSATSAISLQQNH
jgi:hypothetical protein